MSIDIETVIVVRTHPSGRETAVPMAQLDLAAHGEEAITELRLYLESYLATAPAGTRASFGSGQGASLRFTSVEVPHAGTPKRHRSAPRISIASLTMPGRKGTWVIILPLVHTFWVDRGDDVDEAIRRETVRIAAAMLSEPWDYLRLLPPDDLELSELVVSLKTAGREAVETARRKHRHLEEAHARKHAVTLLHTVATPWHEGHLGRPHPPVVGRKDELQSLGALLESEERSSVLLVGDELAGKSALLAAWFADAHRRHAARPVYRTSAARLLAGMSGLGQWQARVSRVLEAAEVLDAILYFDSIGELFGDRVGGGIDIPGILKPFLDDRRVRLVAEVHPATLDVLEPRNAGFFAALGRVKLAPLDEAASASALHSLRAHHLEYEPDRPRLDEAALGTIVHLVDRYLPYLPHPGKAVRLYTEVRATHEKDPSLVGMAANVGATEVERLFSLQTGIPAMLLAEEEALDVANIEAALRRRVIGQDAAVRHLADTVAVMKSALSPADKPLGVFLFVGPTGVGKTELARALAELVFGSEARLSRFDMSEYGDPSAALRLIRGTDRRDGLLTQAVRQQPFGIVLLDEIEKAHPAVYDLLLGALGEARLTDARGRTAYLHNTVVIMTSNVGARANKHRIGIGTSKQADLTVYVDAARRHFRPEFLNRLDRIVPFHPLRREEIQRIARMQLRRIEGRRGLTELGVGIDIAEDVLDRLAERGYSEAFGARALRRTLEDDLVVPMAELLAREAGGTRAATISVSLASDDAAEDAESASALVRRGLRFTLSRGDDGLGASGQGPFFRIAARRRAVDLWYHLPPLEQLRDQVDFLVAQMNDLSRAKKAKAKRRAAALLPALATDHHRLSKLSEALTARHGDLCAAEELAFAAHLIGQDEPLHEEAALSAVSAFRRTLPYALLALLPERDAVTLIVQEADAQDGFGRWLRPLFAVARPRRWRVTVHVPVTFSQPGLSAWPANRFWGPPQSSDWLDQKLEDRGERIRDVLVSVKGPYAGVLLGLEAGLHRWMHPTDRRLAAHLSVILVAMRADLTNADYEGKLLLPATLPEPMTRVRLPTVREHDGEARLLRLGPGKLAVPQPDDYWEAFDEIACEHLLSMASSGEALPERFTARRVPTPGDGAEDGPSAQGTR